MSVVLLCRRLRYGYAFRRIRLTQGKFAIVDPADYPRLAKYKWYAAKTRGIFYAVRAQWSKNPKKLLTIKMHRMVIDVPEGLVADHINHDDLDNRRANLRVATLAGNARNVRHPRINAASRYQGVWFISQTKPDLLILAHVFLNLVDSPCQVMHHRNIPLLVRFYQRFDCLLDMLWQFRPGRNNLLQFGVFFL